jgi:carbamate kinase
MLVVMALGGNALLRRGQPPEDATQRRNVAAAAARSVAPVAREHKLIVTHGNGPQIGLLALQAAAFKDVAPYPLDVLGAESEGMIGYLIEQALAAELPGRDVATLLTQVEVAPDDPAFRNPTKPIGPVYDRTAARRLAEKTGWSFMPDGDGYRRAIASPQPRRIRELNAIRLLVEAGVIVICAGGGGVPVVARADGGVAGVEAVIDKDLSSALLAEQIGADVLLLLTDVPAVWTAWPKSRGEPIGSTTPAYLRGLQFAPGSMAPKVDAACRFAERTGRWSAIGAIEQAEAILAGAAGTIVRKAD